METKSAIGILEGSTIRAVLCESGDYVELAPRLQDFWSEKLKVVSLIDSGSQKCILNETGVPSDTPVLALRFFNFADFMSYFEARFCEDYYLLDDGVWYYASAGERKVIPLTVKLRPFLNPKHSDPSEGCPIHGHRH